MEELLWGQLHEVRNASKTPLPGRALLASLIVDDKIRWKAVGFTANEQKGDISATAFQGWHSPHMLEPDEVRAGNLLNNRVHQQALSGRGDEQGGLPSLDVDRVDLQVPRSRKNPDARQRQQDG